MMQWAQFQTDSKKKDCACDVPSTLSPLLVLSSSSSSPPLTHDSDYYHPLPLVSSPGSKLSPTILFTIIILAGVFFISGFLHLLSRYLLKRGPSVEEDANGGRSETSGAEGLQRQLQQLFHLHDSGLDQSIIDALPIFLYREIVGGLSEPFDCPVCLCEFSGKDKLRLLPLCSHAFHIDCIDTWLLSNSTCPLCRRSLYCSPGSTFENPMFRLEDGEEEEGKEEKEVAESSIMNNQQRRVFSIRLGKFRGSNVRVGETSSSSNNGLDGRRCFSMGSYQYVVSEVDLQVALHPNGGCGINGGRVIARSIAKVGDVEGGKRISSASKGESLSVSKVWLWSKKKATPTALPNSCQDRAN
ncbi:hypothetical protein SAY86_020696 [Trapa natans]|uniref:RING-type E3 ubiquitin transferase n=1 Tax=Trapa natans TaxID=22666 RepID=A0AAN7R4F6_TRANT|nr:hypothetical protein SAY86_020696 [Trapa natans]